MARYVTNKSTTGLYPSTPRHALTRAQIDAWVDTAVTLYQTVGDIVYPILGYRPFDKQYHGLVSGRLQQQLHALNLHLQSRTYLVGPHITLADIVVAAELLMLYCLVCLTTANKCGRRAVLALLPGMSSVSQIGT